jgi:hypothetical protein
MRTVVPTLAGLIALVAVSARATPAALTEWTKPNATPGRRSSWLPMDADTANGVPSGKTNGASGIGVAAFRRRGEAYRATSSRDNIQI